jgi:heme/copper-type cytochrome/quinol oxidase subunit 2
MKTPLFTSRELLHLGHDHSEEDNENETEVLIVKLVTMLLVFLVTIGFTLIPLKKMKKYENVQGGHHHHHSTISSLANCLSAGILMGFAFLHLVPAAANEFENGVENETITDLNLIYLFTLFGFFSVLAIEKIVYIKTLERDNKLKSNQKVMELPKMEDEEEGAENGNEVEETVITQFKLLHFDYTMTEK